MANLTEQELRNKRVYKERVRNVAIKIEQYKEHPIYPYVQFVQRKTAEYFKITFEDITGPEHTEIFFIPRCIAIRIIDDYTRMRYDIMYMFDRDRSTYYNIEKRLKDILFNPLWEKGYEKLKKTCSMEEFEKIQIDKNLDDYKAIQNEQ